MRWAAAALLLLLAACGRTPEDARDPATGTGDGAALEHAAIAAGLVADPARIDPVGTYGTSTDLACVLPRAGGTYRVGASVDLGENQHCVARGSATGRGALAVDFGGDCAFAATLDGDRLSFPAVVPAACRRTCVGRASLAALAGERLGRTAAEASRMRGADGALLCPG